MTGKLKNKTALITGASRGIGLAVAKAYVRAGAHVILIARTRGGLEEADDAIRTIIDEQKARLVNEPPIDQITDPKTDPVTAATNCSSFGGATLVPLNLTHGERVDALGPSL